MGPARAVARWTFVLASLPLWGAPASAQELASATSCWRPAAPCERVWLTELSVVTALAASTRTVDPQTAPVEVYRAFGSHLSWAVGHLWRVRSGWWVGADVHAGYFGPAERFAVRLRGRRFLGETHALDLAVGPLWAVVEGSGQARGPGWTADARLALDERVALTLRFDRVVPDEDPDPGPFPVTFPVAQAVYGGVTLGTTAALWGTAAVGGVGLLYVLAYAVLGPDS